ncbi:MAG TPA: helix-turn-helix domain-containing protein [Blastocatellia bacterium]|nr:helix-turn-helix domain-containing protein [Blastocatellia bacterium]
MDIAGPLQTFHEANGCGARYSISVAATSRHLKTAQLVTLSHLSSLPKVGAGDLVVVPGFDVQRTRVPVELKKWLRTVPGAGAYACAVCTGAFAIGEAGLLDGRDCTTHWKRLGELQKRFPAAHVLEDRLFVTDGPVTTSAGVASGVDTALWFVEKAYGPMVAARVAREMIVHVRRDGSQKQHSVYLDYRTHLNSGVHRVQDFLTGHPEDGVLIPELAKIARMSPRTLTRSFRVSTGLSIAEYRTKIRIENAKALLHDPDATMERIAEQTGFNDPRNLRRAWRQTFGMSPSSSKKQRAK